MALKTAFLFIALHLRKSRYYLLIPTFIDIFAAEKISANEAKNNGFGSFRKSESLGLQTADDRQRKEIVKETF